MSKKKEVKVMNEDLRNFVETCLSLSDTQQKMVAVFVNGLQIGEKLAVDKSA